MQIVEARHGVRVERHDDVAIAQAGAARGPVGLDRDNEHAGRLSEVVEAGDAAEQRNILAATPR